MSVHPYNLRSRVNSPATSRTPGTTPTSNLPSQTHRKPLQSSVAIQLDHVIGTTTKNPSGLSSSNANSSFAYCAGSFAVLTRVDDAGTTSNRYYRARPAAIPVNAPASYYSTPTSTPTKTRAGVITPRRELGGSTPNRAPVEDKSVKTWAARERIKSVKCVSLSSDGKLLAVGETGYNPRVLLFSATRDASTETPLSIITDHTWGVQCIAFSPDCRFLATLGEPNDGFLFIWSVNPKTGGLKLCATNRCTANIHHMAWCGQHLITVGTRHVKVWQLANYGDVKLSPTKRQRLQDLAEPSPTPGPVPLSGRNCLLGELVDATFTCIVATSDQRAVVCTDVGSLCDVDVSRIPADMTLINHGLGLAGAVGCREGSQRLIWAGGGGDIHETEFDTLFSEKDLQGAQRPGALTRASSESRTSTRATLRQSLNLRQLSHHGPIAITCLTKHTVCIDNSSNLLLTELDPANPSLTTKLLSSHNEPVQGVQALDTNAGHGTFFTWSKSGEVRFWSGARLQRVEHIELNDSSEVGTVGDNELKVLRHCGQGMFLSGDRSGVVKVVECDPWRTLHTARAHGAEVNDICVDNTSAFVATCSRDRMVQVFDLRKSGLELLQTTDDHIAAVNQVMFSQDGSSLLSSSADRTIVVREKVSRSVGETVLVAFLSTRIITIKASPLSMCLMPGQGDVVFVSSLDRHVTKVDFTTGAILESFKITDPDTDDNAALNAIRVVTNSKLGGPRNLLVGMSSTDKSFRVYDLDKQALLSKESAHTEGVSDLALVETGTNIERASKPTFVSTGLDSTIMMWTVVSNNHVATGPTIEPTPHGMDVNDTSSDSTPAKASTSVLPPLRKILTRLDVAEFVQSKSPRTPTRDPSPVRLKRNPSALVLTSSSMNMSTGNASPALIRRASVDGLTKMKERSPSPPAYATRRNKRPPVRDAVTNDLFAKQPEWLRRSPPPPNTPSGIGSSLKQDSKTSRAKSRKLSTVPTNVGLKGFEQRRTSTVVPMLTDSTPINLATEHTSHMLKAYRRKLQSTKEIVNLNNLETELEATLREVRKLSELQTTSSDEMHATIGQLEPTAGSGGANPPATRTQEGSANVGLGVDELSISLEKTGLT